MTTCLEKAFDFVRVFLERLSFLYLCPSFPFAFEDGMWDVFVLIPDHYLSIYFPKHTARIDAVSNV